MPMSAATDIGPCLEVLPKIERERVCHSRHHIGQKPQLAVTDGPRLRLLIGSDVLRFFEIIRAYQRENVAGLWIRASRLKIVRFFSHMYCHPEIAHERVDG